MESKAKKEGLAGADNMRIIRFEAEHIKKIQVVQITPSGHVVEISGKNGAGKTSILDSIWWALAGTRTHQPDPIPAWARQGADQAEIWARSRSSASSSARRRRRGNRTIGSPRGLS